MLSPAFARVAIARNWAACPEDVAIAPTPFSSLATRLTKTSTVGFEIRLETCQQSGGRCKYS